MKFVASSTPKVSRAAAWRDLEALPVQIRALASQHLRKKRAFVPMELLCVPHFRALLKRGIAVSLKCISLLSWIRSRMNKWFESPQNFGRLVLACIETDFCKWILNTRAKALDDICKIDRLLHHSDLKISAKISSDFFKMNTLVLSIHFSKWLVF